MAIVIQIVHLFFRILILIIIIQAFLSYFMSPYDPIRMRVDRFMNPILAPIRRIMPPTGMFDFSPLILIIILYILDAIIIRILSSFSF